MLKCHKKYVTHKQISNTRHEETDEGAKYKKFCVIIESKREGNRTESMDIKKVERDDDTKSDKL